MKKLTLILAAALIAQIAGAESLKEGKLVNVKQLTSGMTRYENPRWSPDGMRIAYTQEGFNGLYMMNRNGAAQLQLTDMDGVGYGYQWSADSREILVRDTRWEGGERQHAAWSVSVTGKAQKLTADAPYMQPAAWRYSKAGAKNVMAPNLKKLASEAQLAKIPSVIAEKAIAANVNVSYICDSENLILVGADGTQRVINQGPSFNPVTSPDGKRVAFNDYYYNVVVMNLDGTDRRVVAQGYNPSWVNNSQLVYERCTDDGHVFTSGELYINSIDGKAERALTATPGRIEMMPCVSPDGNTVVFISNTDGQIYSAELR